MKTQIAGRLAEDQACDYLIQKGLQFVTRNYQCKGGEIDLIMRDKQELVFTEVRYRTHREFGNSLESVTYQKQKKIIKTAQFYLTQHRLMEKIACRFDVIALSNINPTDIVWIKNAFQVDYTQ